MSLFYKKGTLKFNLEATIPRDRLSVIFARIYIFRHGCYLSISDLCFSFILLYISITLHKEENAPQKGRRP